MCSFCNSQLTCIPGSFDGIYYTASGRSGNNKKKEEEEEGTEGGVAAEVAGAGGGGWRSTTAACVHACGMRVVGTCKVLLC